jgi:hypothetical protein
MNSKNGRRYPICGTVPCRECRRCASTAQAPQPKRAAPPADRQKLTRLAPEHPPGGRRRD